MAKILIYNGTTPQWIEIPNATVTPADGEIPATLEFDAVTELADSFQNNQESQDKIIELLTDPESNFIQNVAGDLLNNHLTDIIGPTGPRGESFQVDAAGQLNLQVIQEIESNQASEFDFYVYVVTDDLRDTEDLSQRLGGIDSGEGDAFVDLSSHVIMWNGDSWYDYGQFTGLQGPTGATGATGATGSTGPGVLVDLNYSQTSDEAGNITITVDDVAEGDPTVVSCQITTTGGPVQIIATGDANPLTALAWATLQLFRNDGESDVAIGKVVQVESSGENDNCPYALNYIDHPSAGTYTYKLKVIQMASANGFEFSENDSGHMTVVELKGVKGDDGTSSINYFKNQFLWADSDDITNLDNPVGKIITVFIDNDPENLDGINRSSTNDFTQINSISIGAADDNDIDMSSKISLDKIYEISLSNVNNEYITFRTDEIIENSITLESYSYRGFKLAINRIWGDDPSINNIIIYNENDNPTVTVDGNRDNEDFTVSGLTVNSSIVAAINVYGYDRFKPITATALVSFFNAFIDNIVYDANGNINDIATIRSNFYDNTIFQNLLGTLPRLYQDFEFTPGWGSNYIDDGGDDQYDESNYINTNLQSEINYGETDVDDKGAIITGNDADNAFGVGSSYVTLYRDSIFAMIATNANITSLSYSGNLGADGTGYEQAIVNEPIVRSYQFDNLKVISKSDYDSQDTYTFSTDELLELNMKVISNNSLVHKWRNPQSGNDWFIKTYNGGKIVTLSAKTLNDSGYPVLTTHAAKVGVSYIQIVRTEQIYNFFDTLQYNNAAFSLDNGVTWVEYNGGWGNNVDAGYMTLNLMNDNVSYDIGTNVLFKWINGGQPVAWFNKDTNDVRGAVINYHAYTDDGTIIGNIIISRDTGDEVVVHSESTSGNEDIGKHELWYCNNEGELKYRYVAAENDPYIGHLDKTLRIHWTSTVFEGPDFWD